MKRLRLRSYELIACFRAGLDTLHIAQLTGMSEARVYNRLHHAREARRAFNAARRHQYHTARVLPIPRGLAGGAELLPSPASAF